MILRLVFSFFFISLVTGNQRWDESEKNWSFCETQHCDKPVLVPIFGYPPPPILTQETIIPTLRAEGYYGYPQTRALVNTGQHLETQSYGVELVPEPEQAHIQVIEEEKPNQKTICFTPQMVHKMVKVALEYVSQMPPDLTNLIDSLGQDTNRNAGGDSIEELTVSKPSESINTRTILQLINKPSETRTNLVLKYDLPNSQDQPQCRATLEKLIEIAYKVYLEIEQYPQCRDYLYRYSRDQEEQPFKGYGPDIKSFIAIILEQLDRKREYQSPIIQGEIPLPQVHVNIPHVQEINTPEIHEIREYALPQTHEIHEYSVPHTQEVHEYTVPQTQEVHEFNLPETQEVHEYTVPKTQELHEYTVPQSQELHDFNLPQTHEIHEYTVPQTQEVHEFNFPHTQEIHELNSPETQEVHEFNLPQTQEVHELTIPQTPKVHEYIVPKSHEVHEFTIPHTKEIHEYTIPHTQEIHEYNVPQTQEVHEFTIPQTHEIHEYTIPHTQEIHEYTIPQTPQVHEFNIPQVKPQNEGPELYPKKPLKPEETVDIILDLLDNNDDDLSDRMMDLVVDNVENLKPKVVETIIPLLNANKVKEIPNFKDIILILLETQRNNQLPWSDEITELILSYLLPDQNGEVDSRVVEIILSFFKQPISEKHIEYILTLLRPLEQGNLDSKTSDILIKLIKLSLKNLLLPEHIDVLLNLLHSSPNGEVTKEDEIIDDLSRWNEMGLSSKQLNDIITILKPDTYGNVNEKIIDIIHFLLTQNTRLSPQHINFIISFLYPENGIVDTRRVEIIHFILDYAELHPKVTNALLSILLEYGPNALKSKFLEILLFLHSHRILTSELLEILVALIPNELNGTLDDHQVKEFFILLAQLKHTHPQFVIDILTLLNQAGIATDVVEWIQNSPNNVPNGDSGPVDIQVLLDKVEDSPDNTYISENEYRLNDDGFTTKDELVSIVKWLETQGLLHANPTDEEADLVNKLLKTLELGDRELGVVELTYMLKHEKPLVYQPVYYVKYRLPIMRFIANLKHLIVQNPHLTTDPLKILQEMIVVSNVTEVSPNLQGYPKEEILKLTVNDGDLVQAKILDEQNLSLNEQITYVHGLNADITPEELLQLNRVNEATYYPNLVQIKNSPLENLPLSEMDGILGIPTVHYEEFHTQHGPTQITHQGIIDLPQFRTLHAHLRRNAQSQPQD